MIQPTATTEIVCAVKRQRRQHLHDVAVFVTTACLVLSLTFLPSTSAWISPSVLLANRLDIRTFQNHGLTSQRFASVGDESMNEIQETTTPQQQHHVSIEYCTGCRWMMRSAWMAQELLATFQDELHGVTLIPSRPTNPGGVFRVSAMALAEEATPSTATLLWDRKEQGSFPELKQLKQILRDVIAPEQFLGHSDTPDRKHSQVESNMSQAQTVSDCVDCQNPNTGSESAVATTPQTDVVVVVSATTAKPPSLVVPLPNVAITYCTGCRWLLRAAWMGQELLTTFDTQLNSLTLIPSKPPQKGGTFMVTLNGEIVWDRSEQGRFPEAKELKQLIRDRVDPEKDLGHSDGKDHKQSDLVEPDEEEAAQLRSFFGVK